MSEMTFLILLLGRGTGAVEIIAQLEKFRPLLFHNIGRVGIQEKLRGVRAGIGGLRSHRGNGAVRIGYDIGGSGPEGRILDGGQRQCALQFEGTFRAGQQSCVNADVTDIVNVAGFRRNGVGREVFGAHAACHRAPG